MIRFMHVRDTENVPIATVAMEKGIYEHPIYAAGISVCSKKDQFCKKVGRAIASGRLAKGKFVYSDTPQVLAYNILEEILSANSHISRLKERLDLEKIGRSLVYVARLLDPKE